MRLLYTLAFFMFFSFVISAQTIWTGDIDTDWNNPGNWSAGIPSTGMTVTVPGSTTSGNFPVYSGNPIIDFTIQNAGTITFNDFVYNNGTIINFNVGTLVNNNNYFVNAGSVIFDNDGIFTNTGTFENFGTFDNAASAVFTNAAGALLINHGLFRNNGLLANDGNILNLGMIRSTTDFQNNANVENFGFFENPFGSLAANNSGAVLNIYPGGEFSHNGNFQNNGSIVSAGRLDVQNAGLLINDGSFESNGHLEISGELLNNTTINNAGVTKVNDAGTLYNKNNFVNNGSIETAICGVIIQESPNNIAGPVLHDGIIYELQGTVEVTILEFGIVYNDLSQTKPPVPGCQSGAIVQLDENGEGTLEVAQVDKGGYASCGATIVARTLSQTAFTTADLGSQNVTLTVEDNLGVTASCVATIIVVEYVAPIVAIDDPDIEFSCPADITATPAPGAPTVEVSWTEPAEPTSNCVVGTPCADRTATNTIQCNNGEVYGFYLKLDGTNYHYAISQGALVEFEDGSARLTGMLTNNGDADLSFDLEVLLSGRTFNAPAGSPKDNICNGANTSNWYYYTETEGTLTGNGDLTGAIINISRFGEAFQVGVGANATDGTNEFGASGWLAAEIIQQPNSGNPIAIDYGSNPQAGDINIMLSGTPGACAPAVQCDVTDNDIPGFLFMGEYNNSKYYCSNSSNHTWTSAKVQAEAIGGYLAIVDDSEENEFIRQGVLADYAWIGLSDEETEGTFRWVNGAALTYNNWNSGEPNDSGDGEDYVRILKSNGKWTDRNEHFEAEFVVEIPCSNEPLSCQSVPDNISGFHFLGEYNNSKYYASDHPAHWSTANDNANANGGHLVVINDAGENDFIQSNINPASGSIWTGLNTVSSEGVFQWINGDPVNYTNWQAGEPNGNGVDNAARLKKSSGEWTDRHIDSYAYEYVMEIPCDNTPPPPPPGDGELTVEIISGPGNGAAFFIGETEVIYRVTDDCGNEEICIFTVTVEENPAELSVTCPENIIVDAAPGAPTEAASWLEPSATTNCYKEQVNIERIDEGPANGGLFPVGSTFISYTVTDSCNNLSNCVFSVTVNPTEPVLSLDSCPGDFTTDEENFTWELPTASTTCFSGNVEINQVDGPAIGSNPGVGTYQIAYLINDDCENSAVCVFDVTVEPSCNPAGTPCDDGDDCTTGDTEDGNCNCYGIYTDSDGDGVCDAYDICNGGDDNIDSDGDGIPDFCDDCSVAGHPCDDGDACTTGDTYDADCNCAGTFADSDGDGVCDAEDICNGGDDNIDSDGDGIPDFCDDCSLAGQPCDDGDACTTGDTYDADCNCAGIFADSDGDGVCDAEDICPGGDDNIDSDGDGIPDFCDDCSLAGHPCDDGDACTTGDTYDADCNCAGIFADSDGDGVCDAEDICNGGDDTIDSDGDGIPDFCDDCSLVGQPCDDGDACTTGDTYDADCNCAGIFADSDGDGVCDAEDICNGGDDNIDSDGDGIPDFCDDCSVAGHPCDDSDACTTGDTYDADCNCAGTFADSDYDGVCDAEDICNGGDDNIDSDGDGIPDFCDDCSLAGHPCDDGDACTTGDTYDADCNCAGIFADSDGDGVCDAYDICNGGDDNIDSDGDGIPDFCDDCSVAGHPCDDSDACTTGDTYDADCNCAGTFADSDYDGVCDADDICNGGDDTIDSDGDGIPDFCDDCSVAGQPCDDGDACTTGDTYNTDCNCAGTFADSDYDGVCDAEDICNGGDDNIDSDGDGIPDFCDDDLPTGDPCEDLLISIGPGSVTVSNVDAAIFNVFVFNAAWATEYNCNFSCTDPTVVDLAPGTYIIKVNLRDANWAEICERIETITITEGCAFEPGDPCDDGDACTTGDVYDADCNCAGTFTDSDYDGVCDAEDQCAGFDDTMDEDGDGIPDGCDTNECDNVTDGGIIAGDETGCTGYDPSIITSLSLPSGGSGPIEYIWLSSTSGCPTNLSQTIPGATAAEYNPGPVSETTYFIRCSRRADCDEWYFGESNCVVKTIDEADSDGDGVCDTDDICEGGDDHLDSDGDGIPDFCDSDDPSEDPCADLTFTVGPGSLTVGNINAPIFNVFVFSASWTTEYNCNFSCSNPTVVDLAPGTYYVKVELRDASWAHICDIMETVIITDGCAYDPGSPCDDGDDCTVGDIYDADCNCAGTFADSDYDGVCDSEDVCAGFDDTQDEDGDGIPDGCDSNECDNVTDGGEIDGAETGCVGYDPGIISSAVLPSGGSGPIQYIWLSSTNGCPTSLSQVIPGATGAEYNPGAITETTYYVRCSRRADCEEWTVGESNCIIKYVDDSDSDGDGVCDTDDLCPGGDDHVDVDADGIPDYCDDQIGSDDPCDNIQIVVSDSTITVSGIDAPIFTVMLFNQQWQTEYNCGYSCTSPTIIENLLPGDYFVSVKLYDANWQPICEIMPLVSVAGGGQYFTAGDEIFDFQAQRNGRVVSVYWATNTEGINDHFVIEHSADGNNFEALKQVASVTDNNGGFHYFETDDAPYLGVNYYRIAKIHKDGTIKYSPVRRVEFDIDLSDTAVFPNPATMEVYINLEEFAGRKATISIFNQFGQRVILKDLDRVEVLPYRFDIAKYPAGTYTMYIEMEGTRNFAKQFIITRM